MGLFSGLLEGMTFSVKSPDGNITFELADGRDASMEIAVGTYRRYTEKQLEGQLGGLLDSFWTAHRQAHLMMLSELAGYTVRGGSPGGDPRSREFVEERAAVRVEGRSTSGCLVLSSTGTRNWQVGIKAATIRSMDEEAFLNDFWSALTAAINDYKRKVAKLRKEIITNT